MDILPNEDAEACFAILQTPEVIIDESSNLSEEIVLEDCTVEIQSTDIEYCPPYVEQTIELDSEEIIELDSEEIIELDSEETIDHYEEIPIENEEIIIEDETLDDNEIISEDLLIPTAECEIEIEQDYEINCVYIKEENNGIMEIRGDVNDDDDDDDEIENSRSNNHYYCHICENSLPSENALRSHMLQHTHRTSTLFKCAVCKLMFQDTTSLATHMIKDHPDNESFYTCNLCDKTFKRKFNLDFHYLEHCKGKSTLYKCSICGELFSSNNTLKNHIMLSHNSNSGGAATTSGERVECGICSKTFQKSYLRIHMSTHMSNTEYTCHFCNKHLSSKQSLYMHMNTVHANEGCYECTYCDKRFFWKSYLDRHITVHTKEKSHHCTLCSKAFTRKLALRKHMATHTGAKDKYVNFSS